MRFIETIALILALVLGASFQSPLQAGDFEDGEAAFKAADYARAASLLQPLAEQGNPDAQFMLGLMYHLGRGVSQDYGQAVSWTRKAAEKGHAKAHGVLGSLYYRGHGVPKDHFEAAKWYRQGADRGDGYSQFNLGIMYEDGEGVVKDPAEGLKWIRKAAEQGQAQAQLHLGVLYSEAERSAKRCGGVMVQGEQGQLGALNVGLRWIRRWCSRAMRAVGVSASRGQGHPKPAKLEPCMLRAVRKACRCCLVVSQRADQARLGQYQPASCICRVGACRTEQQLSGGFVRRQNRATLKQQRRFAKSEEIWSSPTRSDRFWFWRP
jgi:hypothetical protein